MHPFLLFQMELSNCHFDLDFPRAFHELKLSSMKKTFVVEPVISAYMFASSLTSPLVQQYVYRRYWEEMVNSTFVDDDNVSYCEWNQSDPTFLKQKRVQENASLFAMKVDLSGAIPSILMAFVLVANGERCGRKISLVLPLVGSLVCSIFYSLMSFYSLPLVLLLPLALISGIFGGMATFFGGAFSFVVDLCETQKQKTIRIAVVDLILGLMSGLGGLASGFILKGIGFEWTFIAVSLLHIVNISYTTCWLDETVRVSEFRPRSLRDGFKETFSGVYVLFKSSSCEKRISIVLLLCTFMAYLFLVFGGFSLYTLYELNAPLCWDAIYIGYGSAVSTSTSLTGFLGVVLLSRCLRDIYLVFIGIFSFIGGMVMTAFATTTLLMFLARVPSMLVFVPIPVLRSMLSKVVLPHEQGAIFACIACLEVVTGTIAIAVFNSLYAATVAWFPGFTFLFSAGFCIVPLGLLSWLMFTTWHEENFVQFVNEEDASEEQADS
nr:solute carrier family 46 member 3 isoform X2 [Pogona vitticeps]